MLGRAEPTAQYKTDDDAGFQPINRGYNSWPTSYCPIFRGKETTRCRRSF